VGTEIPGMIHPSCLHSEQRHSFPLQARVSVQQAGLTNSDCQGEGRNVGYMYVQAERESKVTRH